MKQHILGFTLFSFIIASFAIIFTFFYAPSIPSKEAVKPPVTTTVSRTDKPTSCFPKRVKDFSYEVVSANYFAEQGKFVAKVKLFWNGRGEAPETISVQPRIFTAGNFDRAITVKTETLDEPFEYGSGKIFTIESKFVLSGMNDAQPNLYVLFDFADGASGINLTNEKSGLSDATQVLYVYGKNSVIKPRFEDRNVSQ